MNAGAGPMMNSVVAGKMQRADGQRITIAGRQIIATVITVIEQICLRTRSRILNNATATEPIAMPDNTAARIKTIAIAHRMHRHAMTTITT